MFRKRKNPAKMPSDALDEPVVKMRRQYDPEDEDGDEGDYVEDEVEDDEDEAAGDAEQSVEGDGKKHIHPCICDLDIRRRAKIAAFMKQRKIQQIKFERRVKEIEDELDRLEEERLARERELQEQQELFGDEYEVVGKKKKRKKRSARRASMVSLGVKQVINWKKQPKHPVKYNSVSNLRREFTAYCGFSECPPSPQQIIDYRKEPKLAIRVTHAFDLRSQTNHKLKKFLIDSEDKRPPFVTPYYV